MTGETIQERILLSAAPRGGRFEILAISAGSGNGWEFPDCALRESLPLWDGRECYLDHSLWGHSVRDLAGVLHSPVWDEARQGIRLTLKAVGPGGPVLEQLAQAALTSEAKPDVGFSADIVFSADGRRIRKILRVLSVDVVMNPARGGAFLRALNQQTKQASKGGKTIMDEQTRNIQPPAAETAQSAAAELEKARDLRAEMCSCLLEQSLSTAQLPAPLAERIRAQFGGKTFEPAELQAAIQDGRSLAAQLGAGAVVQGPGRISGMVSSEDQLTAAAFDLLGADRPDGLKSVHAARLSGIRELYTLLTGDHSFYGGYYPERAALATTASLPGLLKNALNKLIVMGWQDLGRSGYRWWEPVVSVEHFTSLHAISGVLVGEVTVLPSVAEGDPYTELEVKDSSETASWTKYGGYIGLTLEMFERDETHKLRQYPYKLASAALRRISALVGSVFTANSGAGPQMADGFNVFDASNHGNLGSAALSSEGWEAASQAIYEQPMLLASGGTAPKLALDARYCLVPRSLRLTAMRILYPAFEREATIFSENMQRGEMGDVITCPEFSDAEDWAAVADPRLAPGIIVAERFGLLPEIFISDAETSGALFTNDEVRMKVRHWLSVFVADYRPLYKANVV
jgi:hypothetical protein